MSSLKPKPLTTIQKLILRFVFLYFLLYIYPYGFEYINEIDTNNFSFWKGITIGFGEIFLGWEYNKDILLNGLDSKYDFTRFLLVAVISLIGALLWVFIDSKIKKEYNNKLKILLQTILRYHIGLTLILYGLSKVFLLQFGTMDIDSLETPIGEHNGMNLVWAFMSYSKFYGITAGLIEVVGGLLLLFRRTTSLGAFLLLIAMTNVVLMDIGYDVIVKMFAIHLLIMIVVLMWDDLKQLYVFFLRNRTSTAAIYMPLFEGSKSRNIRYITKGALLLYVFVSFSFDMTERIEQQHSNHYENFTSSHDIEIFVKNGDTIPENKINGNRWNVIRINDLSYLPETLMILNEDNTTERYKFTADTLTKKLHLTDLYGDDQTSHELTYKALENKVYIYQGIFKGDSLWMKTSAKTLNDYRLTRNRIRWIRDLE
ncbi:DoxX family protein [Maribacter aquivivus]|uniref:DoxX family protein n=1 Tax=Maribacter aquivivus TaxID=228958 RepID=UPI00248FBDC0|nr:DoxX family protein [Maribacter aquivivus]